MVSMRPLNNEKPEHRKQRADLRSDKIFCWPTAKLYVSSENKAILPPEVGIAMDGTLYMPWAETEGRNRESQNSHLPGRCGL